ncbi:hypothetical protein [Sphingomonas montanisoli]|uniref:Uncharacterized protein n=1 Tax=Sphingomonas montanisoli TaxID=2606412 RepID=A0A5D9CCP8_9SPHN|nr:hypothetical protein [Sphingomonas montanisoli]TZG28800.1 hypothetical protein FYJ91_01240 [Sphingomonas montanisoli]
MKLRRSSIPIRFVMISCLLAVAVGIGTRKLEGKHDIGATTKTAAEDLGALGKGFVEALHRANDALRN